MCNMFNYLMDWSICPIYTYMSLYFSVLSELDVTFLETALLAFPEFENEALALDIIKPYWEVLEDLFHKEVILSLGIADLDKNLLEELFDWAVVSKEIAYIQ